MNKWNIVNSVLISSGHVFVNGEKKHALDPDFVTFSKEIFNTYSKGYGKFFKMDKLSKLGFLSSEIVLKNIEIKDDDLSEVAVVIGNSEATTPTDIKYFESIKKIPSPAVFVYTLPNILIGEICIRNKFFGENLFFVSENNFVDDMLLSVKSLTESTNVKYILAAWVNYKNDNDYLANIYLISQDENKLSFSKDNIQSNLNILQQIS